MYPTPSRTERRETIVKESPDRDLWKWNHIPSRFEALPDAAPSRSRGVPSRFSRVLAHMRAKQSTFRRGSASRSSDSSDLTLPRATSLHSPLHMPRTCASKASSSKVIRQLLSSKATGHDRRSVVHSTDFRLTARRWETQQTPSGRSRPAVTLVAMST